MANTLTNLLPTLYDAVDVVSRELIGFIPSVTRNSSAERVAVNQTVTWSIAPAGTTGDITPGATPPDDGDQTIGTATLTIDKSKYSPVRWSGEEWRGVSATGLVNIIHRDQFAQAMRALVNLVETDLAAAAYKGASRAYGTGGTTPFGTAADFSEFAGVMQILDDNGAPMTDRHLVLGSAAMANVRGKQSLLFKANEAGTDDLLRRGIIAQVMGLDLHNSGQIKSVAIGTGASYIINGSYAAGATTIAVDTGTGTVLAGDVVVLNSGDANKYVVKTGITAAGNVILNNPGALKAGADNATLFAISTAGPRNVAFHRSAIQLVTRAPAMPDGGDMADDVTEVTDPISGLAFQIAMYKQYRRTKFEVGLAWGTSAVKSEHIAVLLG